MESLVSLALEEALELLEELLVPLGWRDSSTRMYVWDVVLVAVHSSKACSAYAHAHAYAHAYDA